MVCRESRYILYFSVEYGWVWVACCVGDDVVPLVPCRVVPHILLQQLLHILQLTVPQLVLLENNTHLFSTDTPYTLVDTLTVFSPDTHTVFRPDTHLVMTETNTPLSLLYSIPMACDHWLICTADKGFSGSEISLHADILETLLIHPLLDTFQDYTVIQSHITRTTKLHSHDQCSPFQRATGGLFRGRMQMSLHLHRHVKINYANQGHLVSLTQIWSW